MSAVEGLSVHERRVEPDSGAEELAHRAVPPRVPDLADHVTAVGLLGVRGEQLRRPMERHTACADTEGAVQRARELRVG